MSSRSSERDIEFARAKYCTETAHEMVAMLKNSRFSKHRKIAVGLQGMLDKMSAEAIDTLMKKKDSDEFEKLIMS